MAFQLSDGRLLAMLRGDVPSGDLTTRGLGMGESRGQVVCRTRASMTTGWVEQAAQPMREIAVEAERVDEAVWFAGAGVNSLQRDKLAPEQVAEAVRALAELPRKPLVAPSPGPSPRWTRWGGCPA